MKRFRIVILLLLSVGLFSCASSPNNSSAPADNIVEVEQLAANNSAQASSSTPAPGSPDEVICRREQLTGSNFRRRVCLTRAQRAEMRTGSRDDFIERRSATIGR